MSPSKNNTTFLIICKDKQNCKTLLKNLEKKYRKNIRDIHETSPFANVEKIKANIIDKESIKIINADFIVEVETKKHLELDKIKLDFKNSFTSELASVITT